MTIHWHLKAYTKAHLKFSQKFAVVQDVTSCLWNV